jgi:hypothetical protein
MIFHARKSEPRLWVVAVTLAMTIAPTVMGAVTAQPAEASPPAGPATTSGQIVSVGSPGMCLDSSLTLTSCDGNYGQQLWTMEADGTIRIWAYDSYSGNAWDPASQKCLNVPTQAQNSHQTNPETLVGLHVCDTTTVDGSAYTDTWAVHPVTGQNYALLYNNDSTRCLTSQITVASCSQSNTSEQWKLPAETNTQVHQAASAVLGLQAMYDTSTGLFEDSFDNPCTPRSDGTYGGNCWWWSANTLYAIIDFLENAESNNSWTGSGAILADIGTTYSAICNGACPTLANEKTSTNHFQNDFYDDTANWALTWLNAYELSAEMHQVNPSNTLFTKYLYLAENLWYYITDHAWDSTGTHPWSCGTTGGVVQSLDSSQVQSEQNPSNTITVYHAKNVGSNALYLRLSAWLYAVTGDSTFYSGDSNGGGALPEANWLIGTSASPGLLVQFYNGSTTTDASGARFLLDGELNPNHYPDDANPSDPTCVVPTGQPKETQHEGMAIAALTDMYQAKNNAFYLNVADNLAETVMNDNAANSYSQPEPMIDSNGVLSEDCTPSEPSLWPDTCDVTGSAHVWLPGKGIFIRGMYCLANAPSQSDPAVSAFISSNAQWVWGADQNTETGNPSVQNLNQFGFLWDVFHGGSSSGLGYATQGAAVEALTANLGLPETAMC